MQIWVENNNLDALGFKYTLSKLIIYDTFRALFSSLAQGNVKYKAQYYTYLNNI
jgi:hypothetical protein